MAQKLDSIVSDMQVHCLVENKHVSNNAARSLKVALALVTGFENT